MSKLEFNEVIKLVKELKKNGVLKKKRKRNKNKNKRKINYTNQQLGNAYSNATSYGIPQNNGSNLNNAIAYEQLKAIEQKNNKGNNYTIENTKIMIT